MSSRSWADPALAQYRHRMTAIAAALIAIVVMTQVVPAGSAADSIRPTPRTQVVEIKAPPAPAPAQYVRCRAAVAGSFYARRAATRKYCGRRRSRRRLFSTTLRARVGRMLSGQQIRPNHLGHDDRVKAAAIAVMAVAICAAPGLPRETRRHCWAQ